MPFREAAKLMESIVLSLVDCPESVKVTTLHDGVTTRLQVQVADIDAGKVIGKQGRTARAMRTILVGMSHKHHQQITLDIVRNDHSAPSN